MNRNIVYVIDYGAGNIASVVNMVRYVGGEAEIIDDPDLLPRVGKLLLPGVGSFDHGMKCLKDGGWIAPLRNAVLERGVPILGICLGMQLMCKTSEEGKLPGLDFMDAIVLRFKFPKDSGNLKIPHMGWNIVTACQENALVSNDIKDLRFYFVHSYYVRCMNENDIILKCNYGHEFVAGFHRKNIWGVQFHPEKSHKFGMELFRRFLEV